jgi:hypothetical protein
MKRKRKRPVSDYNADLKIEHLKLINDPVASEGARFAAMCEPKNVEQVVNPKCDTCLDTGVIAVPVFGIERSLVYYNICTCDARKDVLH